MVNKNVINLGEREGMVENSPEQILVKLSDMSDRILIEVESTVRTFLELNDVCESLKSYSWYFPNSDQSQQQNETLKIFPETLS